MKIFVRHFIREAQGVWKCVAPAELALVNGSIKVTPGSRFTAGTVIQGVEIAQLLEEEYERTRAWLNEHSAEAVLGFPSRRLRG